MMMTRFLMLVPFTSVVNLRIVYSFANNMYPGEEYNNETSSGFPEGLDMFDENTGNLVSSLELSGLQAFDSDVDFRDSNTDIFWDPELTLADATISNICASQADPLSLEARDSASCSPSQKEELLPSSQTIQLLEDPMGFLDNNFLPSEGQADEEKPAYPGLLNDQQIKERAEREGEIWTIFHPPTDTEDPCAPYRTRGYIFNVCCQQKWDTGQGMDQWYRTCPLEGCHTSRCQKSIYLELNYGLICYVSGVRLMLILQLLGGSVKNLIMLVACL